MLFSVYHYVTRNATDVHMLSVNNCVALSINNPLALRARSISATK